MRVCWRIRLITWLLSAIWAPWALSSTNSVPSGPDCQGVGVALAPSALSYVATMMGLPRPDHGIQSHACFTGTLGYSTSYGMLLRDTYKLDYSIIFTTNSSPNN